MPFSSPLRRTALLGVLCQAAFVSVASAQEQADRYRITRDADAAKEPQSGRLILFFVREEPGSRRGARPINGPFFGNPQPIASMAVSDWAPGTTIEFKDEVSWPVPLSKLDGGYRVQALFDSDFTQRNHTAGPGNAFSESIPIKVSDEKSETIDLELTESIPPFKLPAGTERIRFVEFRSDSLSEHYGREIRHRAGVVLPEAWSKETTKTWPTVYVIPGYGGRHTGALGYRRRLNRLLPAVYVILDPESPLGHHGFVDTENHGPRGTALVREFIPWLEKEFRLKQEVGARVVTGHSSGGWSSLWLQLQHPDVFGACFSSAPDPVDFRAFGTVNLYEATNLFETQEGEDQPSFRTGVGSNERVRMTVRQETGMELAIHPDGGSGQQWDAWEAMFSPRDKATGLPRAMFDSKSGEIDKSVVEHWKTFDIGRLVRRDWERFGKVLDQRVRLMVGDADSFYLERAVHLLKEEVGRHDHSGDGYIEIVPGADHGTISMHTRTRWSQEMTVFFGLQKDAAN
ncbi:MAG: alpha/beta hydrolase-fold protein [Planctomycetota bacterium]